MSVSLTATATPSDSAQDDLSEPPKGAMPFVQDAGRAPCGICFFSKEIPLQSDFKYTLRRPPEVQDEPVYVVYDGGKPATTFFVQEPLTAVTVEEVPEQSALLKCVSFSVTAPRAKIFTIASILFF